MVENLDRIAESDNSERSVTIGGEGKETVDISAADGFPVEFGAEVQQSPVGIAMSGGSVD
jgi:hypothetical protein